MTSDPLAVDPLAADDPLAVDPLAVDPLAVDPLAGEGRVACGEESCQLLSCMRAAQPVVSNALLFSGDFTGIASGLYVDPGADPEVAKEALVRSKSMRPP